MMLSAKLKEYKTVGSNFAYLSVLNFVTIILPLVTFPYLVEKLGIEMFGLLAFSTSIITYFQILTDYGFNLTATKHISQNRNNVRKISEIVSSVYIIKLLLIVISFIVLLLLINVIPKLENHKLLYILTFGSVVGQSIFPVWYYQGIEKMKIITILNIFAKVLFTILIFVFIKRKSDYFLVPLFNSLGFLIIGIISSMLLYFKYKVIFYLPTKKELFFYLKDGWDIFFSNISVTLYTTSILTILGIFSNNIIVGYYSIADKIVQIIRSIMQPVSQSLFPYLASKALTKKKEVLFLNKKMLLYGGLGMSAVCILLYLLSDFIIFLITKDYSSESAQVLKILSPIPLLILFANIFALFTMIVFQRHKQYSSIIVSAGIISIPLSCVLIPIYHHIGAAITVLLIEIYVTVRYVLYVQNSDLKLF
ncbi:hypothetical protein AC804_11745 [Chryseobacterium sp. Hurlbut01]|nr:hypothetical protein AC804_11745 [Chryseobacterium sp. Hurlbut01]